MSKFRTKRWLLAPHARGMSLIELLVVIAILGLLVAILLPAISAARDRALQATCTHRLRQQALAVQSFHSAHQMMPSLYNGLQGHEEGLLFGLQSHSWRTVTLPFLEESALWDRGDLRELATHVSNQPMISTPVPVFVCPSTPRPLRNGLAQEGLIAGVWTTNGRMANELFAAVTDYNAAEGFIDEPLCIAGPWGEVVPAGAGWGSLRVREISYVNITDGLSKTILLYERAGLPDRYFASRQDFELHAPPESRTWGNVGLWAISGEQRLNHLRPDAEPTIVNRDNLLGMYSFHRGGVQAAFVDTTVRFLSEATDQDVLLAMVSRDRGEIFDLSSLP